MPLLWLVFIMLLVSLSERYFDMAKVTRYTPGPDETFLGGSGVIIVRSLGMVNNHNKRNTNNTFGTTKKSTRNS